MTTSTTVSATPAASAAKAAPSYRWRVIDIVVAAVLGVAVGLLFLLWNPTSDPAREALGVLIPGLSALLGGVWLLPGVLGGLVVRKPGAALFTSLVASAVSMLVANSWGWLTVESGLVQGLGAELIFALFLYRRWGIGAAMLAGAASGVAMGVNDLILWYPGSTTEFTVIYVAAAVVSGTVLAGVVSWLLTRALAKTGVLGRFAAGRERAELV